MAVRPKGIGFAALSPSILGNNRRNSSATAARLRMTERTVGWVMIGSVPRGSDTRTKREQSQDGSFRFSLKALSGRMPCWRESDAAYVRSDRDAIGEFGRTRSV